MDSFLSLAPLDPSLFVYEKPKLLVGPELTSEAPSRNRSSRVMLLSTTSSTWCVTIFGEELPLDEPDDMMERQTGCYDEF